MGRGEARSRVLDAEHIVNDAPIGTLHILVTALCTAAIFVDGFNVQVMGYIMPALVKAFDIPPGLVGAVISSGLVGTLVGFALLAPHARRVGYRRMMILGTLAFGLLTLATTQARSVNMLMGLRFLTGIGLGAVLPCAQTMIGEMCPRRVRSTFMVVGATGVTLGSLFAGVVAATSIRSIGWQGVLWVGGGSSLLVAVALAVGLPQTLDFLINEKRDPIAARALARRLVPGIADGNFTITASSSALRGTIRQLFANGLAASTLLLWSAYVINLLVYSFMQSWMTLLIVGSGHTQPVAITATSVLVAGGILSAFVFGPLMDRVSPYRVLAIAFLFGGGVVTLLGLLLSSSIAIIFGSAFVVGFTVLGIQKGLNALVIYHYPLAIRPLGLSWALGVGRIGQIAGPLIAGGLIGLGIKPAVLFILAGLLMILGTLAMRTMAGLKPEPAT